MLERSITKVTEIRNLPPPIRFEVRSPLLNPLVETGMASIGKNQGTIEVNWGRTSYPEPVGFAEKILRSLVESAEKDVLRNSASSTAHANLALALLKAGQIDEAVNELGTALKIDPTDYTAALTLARVHSSRGEMDVAVALYEQLLNTRPDDTNLLLGMASLLIRRNEYDRAGVFLRRALAEKPNLSYARFLLGTAQLRAGNCAAAIAEFKFATRIDVRTPSLHHALGVAYAMSGDFARAERSFRTALNLAPHSSASVRALSRTLLDQEKATEALDVIKSYLQVSPGDIEARELLAAIYADLKKYSLARSHLRQVFEDSGDSLSPSRRAHLMGGIAATLALDHQPKEAEAILWKAIELAPNDSSGPYENLARMFLAENRAGAALEILSKARGIFPKSEVTRVLISFGYAHVGRFQDAMLELVPLVDSGVATADTYAQLGWLYSWIGDFSKALDVARAGYDRFPGVPGLINNLAYVYLQLGRVPEARMTLEALPKRTEPHAQLIATQGLLKLWEGDLATAKRLYERAAQKASEAGNRNLSRMIRQKLHLELAKLFVRRRDFAVARSEIRRGLAVRTKGLSYENHLKQLTQALPPVDQQSLFEQNS